MSPSPLKVIGIFNYVFWLLQAIITLAFSIKLLFKFKNIKGTKGFM